MRIRNKVLAVFLFEIIMSHSLTAQNYSGDSWAKIKTKGSGVLTIVYYEQPKLIYPQNGQMKGLCSELVAEFAKFINTKYGKTVEVKYAARIQNFTEFMNTVQNTPNLLGVTNVSVTEERKKTFDFTPPFLTNQVIFITHKNAPNVENINEVSTKLKGYRALVISGSTHIKYAEDLKKKHFPSLKIEYANNGEEALNGVISSANTFSLLEFSEFVYAVRRNLPIKKQDVKFDKQEELAFVMPKGSDWKALWDEFLTPSFKTTSQYRKMVMDNLGANFLNELK